MALQISEADRQMHELEAALTLRGGELVAMTEERNRYQRQLEETEGLLSGQKEMMDMVRVNLEAQQNHNMGGFSEVGGGGLDLEAEARAAEMESVMSNLTRLSEELRVQSEGNQGLFNQDQLKLDMKESMENMESSMHSKMEAQMDEMRARMEASMQSQLELQLQKNMESVVSPLKERADEAVADKIEKERAYLELRYQQEITEPNPNPNPLIGGINRR